MIITFFYNQIDITGSVRLRGLVKYLPDYGWTPVILTVKTSTSSCDQNIIYETPYVDILFRWKKLLRPSLFKTLKKYYYLSGNKEKKTIIDRIFSVIIDFFIYPDAINWTKFAVEMSDKIFKDNTINAIISSSVPISSHLIANKLIKQYNIPWIADLRDLWTQNHYYPCSKFRFFFERQLEIKTLFPADIITTVSQPLADTLKGLHHNKVLAIPNGFDPQQINPGMPLTEKFGITYTGALYQGRRSPIRLFRALKELVDERKIDPNLITINFFGDDGDCLTNDIKRYKLQNIVKVFGHISRQESILRHRESQVLLLLTLNDQNEKGVYTGKIFDYLAAKRPILSIGMCEGVINDLLEKTHAGIHVSTDEEIKDQLLRFYQEFQENGTIGYHGLQSEIEKYSHREMAKQFADVLDNLCKSPHYNE